MCYIYQEIQHCRCSAASVKACHHFVEIIEDDVVIEFDHLHEVPGKGWEASREIASNGWFNRHERHLPTCSDWISEPVIEDCQARKDDPTIPRGFACPNWDGKIDDKRRAHSLCKTCKKNPPCRAEDPGLGVEMFDDKGYKDGYMSKKKGEKRFGKIDVDLYVKKRERGDSSCTLS
ncbi:hypothetical protein MAPG_04819 [Magnaporthiopsis poae ATCC 64411]|uniref:Uncharacterized protein n=1 Tax=Magnaporthiopsis poae (strain ATCC 64411 / 73-15) TaxID=644358 RepID=A0A0C4DXR2_MAGP6|nr:hypothetical protein MAPG_04819 [Magnaporthiopsis poae ATCC 64411]